MEKIFAQSMAFDMAARRVVYFESSQALARCDFSNHQIRCFLACIPNDLENVLHAIRNRIAAETGPGDVVENTPGLSKSGKQVDENHVAALNVRRSLGRWLVVRVRRIGIHRHNRSVIALQPRLLKSPADKLINIIFAKRISCTNALADKFKRLTADLIHALARLDMRFELRLAETRFELLHQIGGTDDF